MNPSWPADRGYVVRAVVSWAFFLAAVWALAFGRASGWPLLVLWSLAVAPAVLAGLQFHDAWRLIRRQDEFIRAVTAKRMLVAAGAVVAALVGWSLAEEFAQAPHVPVWLAYPLFWGLFGLVSPLVRDGRA